MYFLKRFFLLFVLVLLGFECNVFAHSDYFFGRIGVTNGLTSNYVTDIIQDERGHIWVASEYGLNRLVGRSITTYNVANSGLKSDELTALLDNNAEHTLWIGTKREGICIFDYRTQQFLESYTKENGLLTNEVISLSRGFDGGLWIVHNTKGIDYYNLNTKSFVSYESEKIKGLPDGFLCACEDGKGNLYVGHAEGGMSIIRLKDNQCKNFRHDKNNPLSIPGNAVQRIFIDRENRIWVGTDNGLALYSDEKEQFTVVRHQENNPNSLLSNKVSDIGQTADGKIWICTMMGGVSILDMQENAFTSPHDIYFQNIRATNGRDGLSSPNACCFLQDSYGNIWIGNFRGGVDVLSYGQNAFRILDYMVLKDGTFSGKQVWGMAIDDEGLVWLGGENEVVAFREGMLQRTISLMGKVKMNTHVSVIGKDKNGMLWFGMYRDGVLLCNPHTGEVTRLDMGEDGVDVCCFYEVDGKMWIGAQSGLFSYFEGRVVKEEKINAVLPVPMVHGIRQDLKGNLWLGTFGNGVIIVTPAGELLHVLDTSDGLASNAVNGLFSDKKGGVWIATRNGVSYLPDMSHFESLEVYTDKHGLENQNVRAVIEDAQGEIWVSTNGGISRWDRQKKRFFNYTQRHGIPLGDFMDGSACLDETGNLYFGSQNGVCCFNPLKVETQSRKGVQVEITEFRSYGTSQMKEKKEDIILGLEDEIRLPYNRNTFRIIFNVLDYTQNPQAEYAYIMEGLSANWFELSDENSVTFRNLSPGRYVFKVKARLVNQEWEDDYSAVSIVIAPPFYLAWYAQLFYALILILVLFTVLRFYKRKLVLENRLELESHRYENDQKLNKERLRFYTNITHELRTPLTLILGPLEDLLADKSLSSKHVNKISIIHDSAMRLLSLINQILEFRKTETENRKLKVRRDNLVSLVQAVGYKYKELSQNSAVKVSIQIRVEQAVFFYDREVITVILDNLMSNALKYTPRGEVILSLDEIEENGVRYTCLSVSDTGYGIEKASLDHIFERYYQGNGTYQASGSGIGLALVKSLADLHEATIAVESEPGKGSCFTLKLLTDNIYTDAQYCMSSESAGTDEEKAGADSETDENKVIVLVVEDNEDIREYIRSSFDGIYEVLTAADGQEGWQLAQEHIPNIIISDIMMPVMDGIEFCRMVKEDMRTSHIPVILLTAKDSLQDKEDGYAVGADSFITKPFSTRLLNSRIHNILENRRKIAVQVATTSSVAAQKNADVPSEKASKVKALKHPLLSRLDQEFLEKVTAIIEENMEMEKMDVGFIADKMCMSHSTLYRKIKGVTELTANEFIRKVRMRKAIAMIDSGDYLITEISDLTGFSSVAYFRQCFKEEMGMTPSEYLKQERKKQP